MSTKRVRPLPIITVASIWPGFTVNPMPPAIPKQPVKRQSAQNDFPEKKQK